MLQSRTESARTTLKEIAQLVGVSTNTVSKVLNDSRSNTRVSEKTRAEILKVAVDLKYRPNEVARSLVRQSTRMLGFFAQFEFLNAANGFLAEVMGGLHEAAAARGYDLVLHHIPSGVGPDALERSLTDRRVDGLIFFAPEGPQLIHRLVRADLPVVAIADACDGVPSVVVADEIGAKMLVHHLQSLGHRQVIYRGWFKSPESARIREQSFFDEAKRVGLKVHKGRVMDSTHDGDLLPDELKALSGGVTAIAAWADTSAEATCDALVARGIRVPEDVQVTGFNGIPTPTRPRWELTTIVAPWRQVGLTAAEHLINLIQGESVPLLDVFPVHLRPGQTTMPWNPTKEP